MWVVCCDLILFTIQHAYLTWLYCNCQYSNTHFCELCHIISNCTLVSLVPLCGNCDSIIGKYLATFGLKTWITWLLDGNSWGQHGKRNSKRTLVTNARKWGMVIMDRWRTGARQKCCRSTGTSCYLYSQYLGSVCTHVPYQNVPFYILEFGRPNFKVYLICRSFTNATYLVAQHCTLSIMDIPILTYARHTRHGYSIMSLATDSFNLVKVFLSKLLRARLLRL